MADNLCAGTQTVGIGRQAVTYVIVGTPESLGSCDYFLVSAANYQQQQSISENFMQWFTFDTTDALGAFAVGLTLWAAGIKLGAIIRTIFYTRR